jgi:hypothetical protein
MPLNEKYVDGLEFCKNPHNGFGENQGVGLKKLLEAVKAFDTAGFTTCILAIVNDDGSLYSDILFVTSNKKTVRVDKVMDAFVAIGKLNPTESHKLVNSDGSLVCRFWWD